MSQKLKVAGMNEVSDAEVDGLVKEYRESYSIAREDWEDFVEMVRIDALTRFRRELRWSEGTY